MIRLAECCSFLSGGTPDKSKSEYWKGDIPWFSPKDMKCFDLVNAQDYINSQAADESATRLVHPGTILVVGRSGVLAHSLPVGIIRQQSAFNQDIKAIIPNDTYDPDFVALYLKSKQSLVITDGVKRGPTVHSVITGFIEDLEIPVLDILEQRQIATKLKSQLAEVETARQAAEMLLRDAQALYSIILKRAFLEGDSKDWPKIALGDVGEVVAGITLGRKTNGKVTRSIPYLRVANVKDGHLDLSDVSNIEATESEIERLLLRQGDILLTEGGDPDKLGRGTFWRGELRECIHQNHVFRVRFSSETYLPEFIAAQIGSAYGKDYFFAHAKKTTGIATINQKVLKNYPVLSPPIDVQQRVMNELENQLDVVNQAIDAAKKQLNEINLLPNRLLAQAFNQ